MKNNTRQGSRILAMLLTLSMAQAALAVNSYAATSTGTATATVIEPISVNVEPTPVLVGLIFDVKTFAASLSTSGPLLRVESGTPDSNSDAGRRFVGSGGGVPIQANSASVVVTGTAGGTASITVSGGTGLTFGITQPAADGAVTIEFN